MLKFNPLNFLSNDDDNKTPEPAPKKLKLPKISVPKVSLDGAAKAVKSATHKYGDARLGMAAAKISLKRKLKGAALAVKVDGNGVLDRLRKNKKAEPAAPSKPAGDMPKLRRRKPKKEG